MQSPQELQELSLTIKQVNWLSFFEKKPKYPILTLQK